MRLFQIIFCQSTVPFLEVTELAEVIVQSTARVQHKGTKYISFAFQYVNLLVQFQVRQSVFHLNKAVTGKHKLAIGGNVKIKELTGRERKYRALILKCHCESNHLRFLQ
jgi:predicted ABC-type sugar transport system permease subunit